MENQEEEKSVPEFFKSKKSQMKFEFWYIICLFVIIVAGTFCLFYCINCPPMRNMDFFLTSFLGGLTGGWFFAAKWFYRVTARGRENQYPMIWERHKLFWRILSPLCAALISFGVCVLVKSELSLIISIKMDNIYNVFGLSFIIGCFYDDMFDKLYSWARIILGVKKQKDRDNKDKPSAEKNSGVETVD